MRVALDDRVDDARELRMRLRCSLHGPLLATAWFYRRV
jgi:hypothetical protein